MDVTLELFSEARTYFNLNFLDLITLLDDINNLDDWTVLQAYWLVRGKTKETFLVCL